MLIEVGSAPPDVTASGAVSAVVYIEDDDVAGSVAISPTSISMEEGESATYRVRLNSAPGGDVTITPMMLAFESYLEISPASLTFTPSNWNTFQTVTVKATPDSSGDPYSIHHDVDGYGDVTAAPIVTVTVSPAVLRVSMVDASYTVKEGESVDVRVRLDKPAVKFTLVNFVLTHRNGASTGRLLGYVLGRIRGRVPRGRRHLHRGGGSRQRPRRERPVRV